MPKSSRSWRVLVPALVVCLLLVGAAVVVRSRHQPAADATVSPTASPDVSSTETPSTSPAPSSPSGTATGRATTTPKPSDEPSLSAAAKARTAALARLAEKVRAESNRRRRERPVAEFTMANFNTQGAVHTRHKGRASGSTRTVWMKDLLLSHGVDLVSLQEFERVQVRTFLRVAGGTYDLYPGLAGKAGDAENAIAWRKDRFEAVRTETRPYPYFNGQIRQMPRVQLRDRKSGAEFWVTSYHNPASIRQFPNQGGWRARAVARQAGDANALLSSTGDPLIVSGDMNDRATYFCAMSGSTGMHAADGSTHAGGCRVAPHPWIDWILGSRRVAFSGYSRDWSAFVRRTSDHPIVLVHARVTGKPGAGANADGASE